MAGIVYTFLVATAILAVGGIGITILAFLKGWSTLCGYRISDVAFITLFFFRYWRLVVHSVAYSLYRPYPVPDKPLPDEPVPDEPPPSSPRGCTVIVPTVDPGTAIFRQCITSIAACEPARILVTTIEDFKQLAYATLEPVGLEFPDLDLQIHAIKEPNKRRQIAHVVDKGYLKTPVTVLADSTVSLFAHLAQSPPCPFSHYPTCYFIMCTKLMLTFLGKLEEYEVPRLHLGPV